MQFQPGNHYDRYHRGGQGVYGAPDPGIPGENYPLRAAGCHRPRHRRPDRTEPGHGSGGKRGAAGVSGGASGHQPGLHRPGRGQRAVQGAVPEPGRAGASLPDCHLCGRSPGGGGGNRLSCGAPPGLYPGGHRRRLCRRPPAAERVDENRPRTVSCASGAGGEEHPGLQGN